MLSDMNITFVISESNLVFSDIYSNIIAISKTTYDVNGNCFKY